MFRKTINVIIFFIAVLLFFPLPVIAEEMPNTFLTLVDVVSKEHIDEVYAKVELNGQVSNYYLEKKENLKLFINQGTYHINILVNNPQTETYDYYGEASFSVGDSLVKVLYLYPIGSINGFVKDKLNNTIAGAGLKFECNNIFPVEFPSKTDKYGSFSIDAVPVGKCSVRSSHAGSIGVKEIEVEKGRKGDVEIQLDHILIALPSSKSNDYLAVLFVFILLIVVGLIIYWKKLMKKGRKEREAKEEVKWKEKVKEENNKLGQRGKDILKTLRENEKKIIEFLLEHKHPAHLSKIHYKTGISKGSVFRNLRSLEHKKLIETFNEGRVRKAKLTEWFMEKS